MKRACNGLGTLQIVIGLCVVAIGIFAFIYFASDVFRTRANISYDQFSSWTPENIAKYPVAYLTFCEKETNKAIEKLKASEIGIEQKRAKLEGLLKEAKDTVDLGNTALGELKVAYKAASADVAVPIVWRKKELDRDQAKRQVLRLASQIKTKQNLVGKYQAAVEQLRVQAGKVQDARDTAREELAKIDANREMLKVQDITNEIRDSLVAMKGTIQSSVVGVASTETAVVSLDELAVQSEGTVDEHEFDKIMAQ
jgi:hypothetical protein